MNESRFVIKLDTWGEYNYYSKHGRFAGKNDVMSYALKQNAKRFATYEEASKYITEALPVWTKKERYVVEELSDYELMMIRAMKRSA